MAVEGAAPVEIPGSVRVVGWLSWTHFLNDGIANYFPGVLPFIVAARHIPFALAGTFVTALLLAQSLQPVSGWLADRVGGRALVLGGVALSTAAAAALGWAHPLWLLLALLVCTGIGNTAFHPQALSITRRHVGTRQGTVMAVFLVGGEIGRSLGPLAAGLVVSRFGLPWLWVLAVPLVLTYPFIVRSVPPAPRKTGPARSIEWRRHLKPAGSLLAYSATRSLVIFEVVTLAPLLWYAHGGSLVTAALLVTVLVGVGIVGNLVGGLVNDRWGTRHVLLGTSILASISLVGFALLGGFWIWPTLGVMGIALFGSGSPTMLIGQDIFRENPALGSGVALGLSNGIGAVLVIPLTYLAAHVGHETVVFILIALTLVTVPAIWGLPALNTGTSRRAAHG